MHNSTVMCTPLLVKIKPTESEAECWFCSWLCHHLWSTCSNNYIVRVGNKNERINQLKCSCSGLAVDWFFCFQIKQSSFHWIISNRVIKKLLEEKETFSVIPPTLISSSSLYFLLFSLCHTCKCCYHSDYDSHSISSVNQP